MKINQIEPWIGKEEKKAVSDYLDSGGWLTEFKKTEELEEMIADYVGTKYCSIVNNGTVSLFCALVAYDIGPGDEVICPDFTMIASANAIKLTGATPVFIDVERHTLCCEMKDIIDKTTNKTKALMLVSINGRYPEDVHGMIDYCRGKDIKIIEDAAQSLGSFYEKNHVGTLGDIGSFSFSMPKIISMGQGGCLVTNDKEIYEKIEMIKDFGRPKSGIDRHEIMGWNFKFTDLLAVIGIEQMKKLPERIKMKKLIYYWYKQNLEELNGIEFIETSNEVAPWFIDVLVDEQKSFMDALNDEEIKTRSFYPAIHSQTPYKDVKGSFPNSDYVSKHGVWLPSSSFLTEETIDNICDVIQDVLKYG